MNEWYIPKQFHAPLHGFWHGLQGGDHLSLPPVLNGGKDHESAQGDGAEEEEEPEDAIQPGQGPVQRVAHAVDRGPRPKLLNILCKFNPTHLQVDKLLFSGQCISRLWQPTGLGNEWLHIFTGNYAYTSIT